MQGCEASLHSARTKLGKSKYFPILMFTLHGVLLFVYLGILLFALRDSDAAFENGALIFGLPGLYLGIMLASTLSNVWVVAQVEIAFGVFALLFAVWGTVRDLNDRREPFVYIFNVAWTGGLLLSFVASILHYIALKRYRGVLNATYGTANADEIVFGRLNTDRSMARREQGESLQQLLQDARSQPEDMGFIGKAVDKTANGMFTVIRAGKTRWA